MNNAKGLFFLILFLLVNTGYSLQDSVVAIVNDKVILQSDLDERMKEVNPKSLSRIEFTKIKNYNSKGNPVLIGTISVEKSEALSKELKKLNISHNVLNAKNHEQEAEIIQ